MVDRYIQIAEPNVGEAEWEALKEPLKSGWLTQGPQVKAFETAFAARHDVRFAYAVTSCTTALHLALAAIDVGPGDLVIVPSFTWIATANAVIYCGATPVFCDSDESYNMDVCALQKILERFHREGKQVKAILPVHLFGLVADMEEICALARRYGCYVVEDAACAAGAAYRERPAGSIGDIGCFSFHPRKVITTGEGGMCTTNRLELAEKLACLRSHGGTLSEEQRHHSDQPFLMADFNVLGYNYRMSDLQGAVGCVQLAKLDALVEERRHWANWYHQELEEIAWLRLPHAPEDRRHSYQAFVCLVDVRKLGKTAAEVMLRLHQNGIGSRPGTHAIHMLGYYAKRYGLKKEEYPVAARLYEQTVALPLHNRMKLEDYGRVVRCLKQM